MYCLGRKLFNQQAGLIAALLSSVNFFLIALSREARSYSLLILLAVVSFLLFFRFVEKKSFNTAVLYTVCASLLVNTHYFGVFPVMTQFALLLYFSIRTGLERRLFVAGGVAASAVVFSLTPVLSYMLLNFKRTDTWIQRPEENFFLEWFGLLFGSLTVALICGMFVVVALGRFLLLKDEKDSLKILLVWWLLGFTLVWVRSSFFTPVLSFKNMAIFAPVIVIFVSCGFALVRDGSIRWILLTFVCVLSVSYYSSSPDYSRLRMEHDLRSPVKKIIDEARNVPVYAGAIYAGYFKVLGSSVRPVPYEVLEARLMVDAPPPCFYVIDLKQVHDYSGQLGLMVVESLQYQDNSIALYKRKDAFDCEPVVDTR